MLKERGESPWSFEAAELPVQVGRQDTRIDFVLRTNDAVLVAECKRANPALARWCFARAPYIARRARAADVRLEQFFREESTGRLLTRPTELTGVNDQYHIGVEMRTAAKGDADFRGRGAIEEAATQVVRGANGLINFVGSSPGVMDKSAMCVVPAVFTTAELLCSDANLALSELATGETPRAALQRRPWIWFQQNISAALEHSLPKLYGPERLTSIAQMLRFRHARSIAVVTPDGIAEFLRSIAKDFEDFHPAVSD